MKIVNTLYRVSTLKQGGDDNDIPVQQKSCLNFIKTKPEWTLGREYIEMGVSGYKVSAYDRDAIMDLKKNAESGSFNVLLVFMFDRIGRIEEETPFIVKWFVDHGVEVWSVKEGERRFENRVDSLINFLTFWQAGGESEKTSVRTKEAMAQMVLEGRWKGGTVPYGYKLVPTGNLNKKRKEICNLCIDEYEATVIRKMFDLYVNAGYGTFQIGKHLESIGIQNRSGFSFSASTIIAMLRNPLYRGVLRSGDSISEPFEQYRIVDETIFNRAAELIGKRTAPVREAPRRLSRKCLLTGIIYCGLCGAPCHVNTTGSENARLFRYHCYYRNKYSGKCCGPAGYSARRIDDTIDILMYRIFSKFTDSPADYSLATQFENKRKELLVFYAEAKSSLGKIQKKLSMLKGEVANSLLGESSFTPELLNESIAEHTMEESKILTQIKQLEHKLQNSDEIRNEITEANRLMETWSDCYLDSPPKTKSMIVSQFIEKVVVYPGYKLEIHFKLNKSQFLGECMEIEAPPLPGFHEAKQNASPYVEPASKVTASM
jgi:DNA invertase Pin-like site-specific DNA recombinase